MEKSPEEENQNLSDERINELVRKAKAKVWLAAIPASICAGVAGYFNQPWLFIIPGAFVVWILLRK
jgi:hypothetical protein